MQKIIKKVREYLKLSQKEFADELNVSFATINRWENGRTLPNKLTQSQIYNLCRENEVPLYNMIIDSVESIGQQINTDKNHIVLYHGSKSGIEGKIRPISRKQCDFGKGFYMGDMVEQALTLISDYEKSKLYVLSVDMSKVQSMEIPADIEWAMFVAYNRGKMENIKDTKLYNRYSNMTSGKDIVIGSIANDRMFYVLDNFFIGNITDVALVKSLSTLKLGKQYVAVTEKGCECIQIEKEIELSYLERLYIKDISAKNRQKGISTANDVCKKYRREGLFYDEIIGGK